MKKITFFAVLLFAASSLFAQTAGDMFVSGSFNISGGTSGESYQYYYDDELSGGYKGLSETDPIKDFNFSITPEFGYFVADNCLLKIGLGYDLGRSLGDYDIWGDSKAPKNPLYQQYGKYWDSEDEEWDKVYAVPFYSWTHLFTIRPAFHYYVAITDNFFYTPGVSLTLGFGSLNNEDWQSEESYDEDYEDWDAEDYEDYMDNRRKEIVKEDAYGAFRFGLNLHLLAFEFRPTQKFGISLSAGEFGYVYDSRYQNFNEKEMKDYFDIEDTKSKSKFYSNDVNFNLNLNAKIGFSYYF